MSNIDFHIHSTASDGSDSIPVLLEKIKAANIHTFSITDHDTIDGTLEMDKLQPLNHIRGIEFSCMTNYKKCHILGYNFDPTDSLFLHAIEAGTEIRKQNLRNRLNFLKSNFDIILTEEESAWLYSQKSPGKPHLGKIIVNRGLAPDLRTAINTYISPCRGGNDRIHASLAIEGILHAGGVPVWAHPLGGEGEKRLSKDEFQTQLHELIQNGIRGLECYYSRYTQEEINFLLEQANANHLFVSGGSDYHGANKSDVKLGQLNMDNKQISENCINFIV